MAGAGGYEGAGQRATGRLLTIAQARSLVSCWLLHLPAAPPKAPAMALLGAQEARGAVGTYSRPGATGKAPCGGALASWICFRHRLPAPTAPACREVLHWACVSLFYPDSCARDMGVLPGTPPSPAATAKPTTPPSGRGWRACRVQRRGLRSQDRPAPILR